MYGGRSDDSTPRTLSHDLALRLQEGPRKKWRAGDLYVVGTRIRVLRDADHDGLVDSTIEVTDDGLVIAPLGSVDKNASVKRLIWQPSH